MIPLNTSLCRSPMRASSPLAVGVAIAMELTSEQVHWIGGAAFVAVALLSLAQAVGLLTTRWISWLLPILLIGYGIESGADWWIHGEARPANYLVQALQHVAQGSAMLIAGVVEVLLLRGRLRAPGWSYVLPVALLLVGVGFWVHQQHTASVDPMVMMLQHRAIAISLTVAALGRAAASALSARTGVLEAGWWLPLLIFGLLMLTYTETSLPMSGSMPGH